MWPINIAPKNAPIITNVHIDRVMKVAFFFSYSDTGGSCKSHRLARISVSCHLVLTSNAPSTPILPIVGEPGSEAASLMSEKLLLRPSAPVLCPFRWLNLIPRRGLAMMLGFWVPVELEYSFSSVELNVVPNLDYQGRCFLCAACKHIAEVSSGEGIVLRRISTVWRWKSRQSGCG